MFWFWFWLVIHLLMLMFDMAWWAIAMRVAKKPHARRAMHAGPAARYRPCAFSLLVGALQTRTQPDDRFQWSWQLASSPDQRAGGDYPCHSALRLNRRGFFAIPQSKNQNEKFAQLCHPFGGMALT
jgi:hypothetical protein